MGTHQSLHGLSLPRNGMRAATSLQSRPGDRGQMDACICSPLIYPLQDLVISPHLLYNPEHPRLGHTGYKGTFLEHRDLLIKNHTCVQSPGQKRAGGGRS